jgi:hypothetical protein
VPFDLVGQRNSLWAAAAVGDAVGFRRLLVGFEIKDLARRRRRLSSRNLSS